MKQTYFMGLLIFTIWALFQASHGDSMALVFWVLKVTVWTSMFVGYLIGGFKPW